jgi:hypothetical protein
MPFVAQITIDGRSKMLDSGHAPEEDKDAVLKFDKQAIAMAEARRCQVHLQVLHNDRVVHSESYGNADTAKSRASARSRATLSRGIANARSARADAFCLDDDGLACKASGFVTIGPPRKKPAPDLKVPRFGQKSPAPGLPTWGLTASAQGWGVD